MNRIQIVRSVTPMAALALVLALGGCTSATPDAATPTPTVTYATIDDWDAAFNDCVRHHGFAIDEDGLPQYDPDDRDRVDEVYAACETTLGPMPSGGLAINPQEQYALWTAVADCLRDLGYQVEDPAIQPGGYWGFRPPADATEAQIEGCIQSARTP